MSTVLIRQIPDDYADSTGLSKYNRSRMPGTKDRFAPAINPDGRFNTGLDEDSFSVSDLQEKERIKALRKKLEDATGKDLSGTSSFWENFSVTIESDKPRLFNTANPMDEIAILMLIANRYVAPDKDTASTAAYRDAQYYAYTEEGEVKQEISERKKKDKALFELFKIIDNKDKLVLYGQYLEGLKYNHQLGEDVLYKMLRAFIEEKGTGNANLFLNAISKSVTEVQQKIIIDKALKHRLIKKVSLGNKKFAYQYGQVTIGNTIEDVYKNLTLVDFAPEFVSIQKELENK